MTVLIDILYALALTLASPYFLYKVITTGKYRRGLRQRFGAISPPEGDGPLIWVHAVSVGELQAAKPLVERLARDHPDWRIVVSHTTRTGEQVAAQLFPTRYRFYSPLDFSWVARRVMKRLDPALLILIELELWPNLLLTAKRRGVPVFLANGRISERSALGYGRNAWFFRRPFAALTRAAVQNDEYAERLGGLFARMGIERKRIRVAGNLKFDNIATRVDPETREAYRRLFAVAVDETLLVCGSTHPGEHELLAELYRRLRAAGLNLRMVIVPRHPEQWGRVRDIWSRAGLTLLDRTSLTDDIGVPPPVVAGGNALPAPFTARPVASTDALPPCILLDTMGELVRVYHAADIVFVGGSLIAHGGQNMAEPAGLGRAVLFGPHVANFRSTVRDLLEAGGALQVEDGAALSREITRLCGNDEESARQARERMGLAATRTVEAGKGAVDAHVAIIHEILAAREHR